MTEEANDTSSEVKTIPSVKPPLNNRSRKSPKSIYSHATNDKKLFLSERVNYGLEFLPETRRIMGTMGYSDDKIKLFKQIFDSAKSSRYIQNKNLSEKVGSYAEFEKQFSIIKEQLYYLVKIVQVVFRDNKEVLQALKIDTRKGRTIDAILAFMDNFYQNCLSSSDILNVLANYSYGVVKIKGFQQDYLKTRELYNLLNKENADAVEATRILNEKMEVLDEWMYEYYSLAKVAYALNPDWLAEQEEQEQQESV